MNRSTTSLLAGLLASLAAAGCGSSGDSGTPPVPPPAGHALVFTAQPAGGVAGAPLADVVVEARDASGALAPFPGDVTVSLASAPPGAVVLGTTTVTPSSTSVTFAGLSLRTAGTHRLRVTSGPLQADGSAFEVAAAAAAQLAFAQGPADVTAGEPLSPAPVVVIADAFGNPVASGVELVSLSLRGADASALLGGVTSATTVLGEVTFPGLSVDRAGAYELVASAAGLEDGVSGSFAIRAAAADPAASEVAAAPATQAVGAAVALTATVRDFFGNPVAGETVTFAATGAGNTLDQPGVTTDASGVATGALTSTRAEAKTVSASIGGAAFGATASVTFEPGAPSAATSTLVASPASVEADGTTAITLTATVQDEFGNPVSGVDVTLSSLDAATLVQPGAPTDAAGVAAGSVTSTTVGDPTIAANVGASDVVSVVVHFTSTDLDGDGVPNVADAFPEDPTRFARYVTVPLDRLGGAFGSATAVNDGNLVVGFSGDGLGGMQGVRWTVSGTVGSAPVALAPIAGNAHSAAYAVDAAGATVGESEKGASYVPVLWAPGATTPTELALGSLSAPAAAYGISGGRIVGEATSGAATVAVLWTAPDAAPTVLPTLGGDRSAAYAVSVASGLVVGESSLGDGTLRGAAWSLDGSGAAIPLAPLPGHARSVALAVEDGGRIVGESETAEGQVHAVAWDIAAPSAPVTLGAGSAASVNAGGRVAGHAGLPVGPALWDLRNPALIEGVLEAPFTFLFGQAYGLNAGDVVVGLLDGQGFAAVPSAP